MPYFTTIPLDMSFFRPGMRVAVAVSAGADSVALLLALLEQAPQQGLVLSVAHVNHTLRAGESDADEEFVRKLADLHRLQFHFLRCDVLESARTAKQGIEDTARDLRYAFFGSLMAASTIDAVATAHTLDDQAETVLMKLLRGAWTEGIGAIHPVLATPGMGKVVRPMLATHRSDVEAFLKERQQDWREDSSNRDEGFTRNRIRHQLLPALLEYNPRLRENLANLSATARDEESYWQAELADLLPMILLPGKPVRGGGRSSSTLPGETSLSIEIERLRSLHPAKRRRVLRAAMAKLKTPIGFEHTNILMNMCDFGSGKAPTRSDMPNGVRAERSSRELRLSVGGAQVADPPSYALPIPGEAKAERFGLVFRATCRQISESAPALIRGPRVGDRVRLQHSRTPKRIKEVFERMQVGATERQSWPVVEWKGEIVWMQGVELESEVAQDAELKILAQVVSPNPMRQAL
jgi:tRNA(Ile)-lysidine synthase